MQYNRTILLLLAALALLSLATCAWEETSGLQDLYNEDSHVPASTIDGLQLEEEQESTSKSASSKSPLSSRRISGESVSLERTPKESTSREFVSPSRFSKRTLPKTHIFVPSSVLREQRKLARKLEAEKKIRDNEQRIKLFKERRSSAKLDKRTMLSEVPLEYRHVYSSKGYNRQAKGAQRKSKKLEFQSEKLRKKHNIHELI